MKKRYDDLVIDVDLFGMSGVDIRRIGHDESVYHLVNEDGKVLGLLVDLGGLGEALANHDPTA